MVIGVAGGDFYFRLACEILLGRGADWVWLWGRLRRGLAGGLRAGSGRSAEPGGLVLSGLAPFQPEAKLAE